MTDDLTPERRKRVSAEQITRRPFPLGRLRKPRVVLCLAARRPPVVALNRYPGQVIGLTLRLPRWIEDGTSGQLFDIDCLYFSLVWATPSRWWKR